MESTNFAYWLQGFFEIADTKTTQLNERQTLIIKKHLELVFTADKSPSPFCNWLKGFLDKLYLNKEKELNTESIEAIQKELSKIFKHVIDLSYDEDLQEHLNNIHNQHNQNNPDNVIYRC